MWAVFTSISVLRCIRTYILNHLSNSATNSILAAEYKEISVDDVENVIAVCTLSTLNVILLPGYAGPFSENCHLLPLMNKLAGIHFS